MNVVENTWYADGWGGPGAVVALWLSGLVRKSITTAIIQYIAVIDEWSDVEAGLQSTVHDLWHLAFAYTAPHRKYRLGQKPGTIKK